MDGSFGKRAVFVIVFVINHYRNEIFWYGSAR